MSQPEHRSATAAPPIDSTLGRPPTVQLLGCVDAADPLASGRTTNGWRSRRHRRLRPVVLGVLALYLAAMLPGLLGGQRPTVQRADTRFGDPFVINWVTLGGPRDPPTDYVRPPPMASERPYCVGFGRLDWSARDRSPSVAHCVDTSFVDALGAGDVAVVRQSIAGDSTWYFLLFGDEIDEVAVELDGEHDLAAERLFHTRRFVALLMPNDHARSELRWTTSDGRHHRCGTRSGPLAGQVCADS